MERIILSKEQLISADIGRQKPGTIHIGGFYIPWDVLQYCAIDKSSFLKIVEFQKELYQKKDKNVDERSCDAWLDSLMVYMTEEIKWEIV